MATALEDESKRRTPLDPEVKTNAMERTKESAIPPVPKSQQDLEALAAQQGVTPITGFDHLLGNFWPEDESADEFIATVREWRREGTT